MKTTTYSYCKRLTRAHEIDRYIISDDYGRIFYELPDPIEFRSTISAMVALNTAKRLATIPEDQLTRQLCFDVRALEVVKAHVKLANDPDFDMILRVNDYSIAMLEAAFIGHKEKPNATAKRRLAKLAGESVDDILSTIDPEVKAIYDEIYDDCYQAAYMYLEQTRLSKDRVHINLCSTVHSKISSPSHHYTRNQPRKLTDNLMQVIRQYGIPRMFKKCFRHGYPMRSPYTASIDKVLAVTKPYQIEEFFSAFFDDLPSKRYAEMFKDEFEQVDQSAYSRFKLGAAHE